MKKQSGFTLVEIAIVMVIIGLLLGGVFKGQAMITNAKVKSIENNFNGIVAAIYSYQDRYKALPGDDDKADRFTGVSNGDGDGIIEGVFNSSSDVESRKLWLHLRNAKLVAGATDDNEQPNNTFGGIIGVSAANVGALTNLSKPYVAFSNIPADIILIIEARLDDGTSTSGSIQSETTNLFFSF